MTNEPENQSRRKVESANSNLQQSPDRGVGKFIFLAMIAVVIVSLIVVGTIQFGRMQGELRNGRFETYRVLEIKGQALQLDEALTNAARMAAATKDPKWKKQHQLYERSLCGLMYELSDLAKRHDIDIVTLRDLSNKDSLNIAEKRVFELVEADEPVQAMRLLETETYLRDKKVFADSLESSVVSLKAAMFAGHNRYRNYASLIRYLTFALGVLLFAALITINLLRKKIAEEKRNQLLISEHARMIEKANTALEKSEISKRLFIENSGQIVTSVDRDGTFLFANTIAAQNLGLTPDEMVGKTLFDVFEQDQAAESMEAVRKVIDTKQPILKVTMKILSGQKFWIESRIQPFTPVPQQPTIAMVIGNDVTERINAQIKLKQSEERYRQLAEATFEGILIHVNGVIKDVNQQFCDIFGYTLDELREVDGMLLIAPESRSIVRKHIEQQIEDAYQINGLRKDGSVFPLEQQVRQIHLSDGSIQRIVAVRDITERKNAEQKLKQSEERYRLLAESSFEGIIIHEDGVILDVNRQFCEMHGLTPEQARNINGFDLIAPEFRQLVWEKVKSRSEDPYEVMSLRPDGTEFPSEMRVRQLDIPGRNIRIGTIRDLTWRKALEAEILEHRIALSKMEKNAYINSMGSIVAHQLNQPLTMINMLLGEAIEVCADDNCSSPAIVSNMAQSLEEAKKAAQVIKHFRKITRDPSLDAIGNVDLEETANNIVYTLTDNANRAKIHLMVTGLELLPPIEANQAAIEQVFLILIQNAIDASAGIEHARLIISATDCEDYIELSFADNCSGIAPENIDKIFEPFFTTKTEENGMGLGLEIVKRILMTCGGSIRVESELGKGSTFFVRLHKNTSFERH